jgi:hypothetical protein
MTTRLLKKNVKDSGKRERLRGNVQSSVGNYVEGRSKLDRYDIEKMNKIVKRVVFD